MIGIHTRTALGRCALLAALALVGLIAGCDGDSVDERLDTAIAREKLTGDPASDRLVVDINEPLPQLGKLLFFSKALGGDRDAACVTSPGREWLEELLIISALGAGPRGGDENADAGRGGEYWGRGGK